MADKLPSLDADKIDERLSSLYHLKRQIDDGFVEIGLEYANKVTGAFISEANKSYFHVRDGVFYRLDSMLYHLQLLLAVQRNQLQELNANPLDSENRNRMLLKSETQGYIFDSIVFHAISLFDYVGNLIDYICGSKSQMRLKWTGVVKSINDRNNPLSSSPIADVIRKLNKDLVDRLYYHRSHVIHYEADRGGAQTALNLQNLQASLTVFAPKRITQEFPDLDHLSRTNRLTLNYVAFWICDQTVTGVLQLIGPILKHMEVNRKILKGHEIFLRSSTTPTVKGPKK